MITLTGEDYRLTQQKVHDIKVRFEIYNRDDTYVGTIDGNVVSGSGTIDAESDIRRSFSIVVVPDLKSRLYIEEQGYIWIDKYVRVYIGNVDMLTGEVKEYKFGKFVFTSTNTTYEPANNQMTINCSDLMSVLDGSKNGELGQLTIEFPAYEEDEEGIPQKYYTIRSAVITAISQLGRINDYQIDDIGEYNAMPLYNEDYEAYREESTITLPDGSRQALWDTIPYDQSFAAGTTVLNIITTFRDLYPNYEAYFDQDGIFCMNMIPSGDEDPVIIEDDFFQSVYISENTNIDLTSVRNVSHVWGQVYEADYYAETSDLIDNIYYVELEGYGTSEEDENSKQNKYMNGDQIAFKVEKEYYSEKLENEIGFTDKNVIIRHYKRDPNGYFYQLSDEDKVSLDANSNVYYPVKKYEGYKVQEPICFNVTEGIYNIVNYLYDPIDEAPGITTETYENEDGSTFSIEGFEGYEMRDDAVLMVVRHVIESATSVYTVKRTSYEYVSLSKKEYIAEPIHIEGYNTPDNVSIAVSSDYPGYCVHTFIYTEDTGDLYVNINHFGKIPIYDENTEAPIKPSLLKEGNIYVFKIKTKNIDRKNVFRAYWLGEWQAQGICALVANTVGEDLLYVNTAKRDYDSVVEGYFYLEDGQFYANREYNETTDTYTYSNRWEMSTGATVYYQEDIDTYYRVVHRYSAEYFQNVYSCPSVRLRVIPQSPFTCQKIGEYMDVMTDEKNITSNSLAESRADWEIYKQARLLDSITLTTLFCPFADVNIKVSYRRHDLNRKCPYIVKNVSHDFSGGTTTWQLMRFYPLYERLNLTHDEIHEDEYTHNELAAFTHERI